METIQGILYGMSDFKNAMEQNHGFCNMLLMPDLQRYSEIEHSYILELKYLPKDKFES